MFDCKLCPQCTDIMRSRLEQGQSIVEQNIISQQEIVERASKTIDRTVNERTDRIVNKVLIVFWEFIKRRKLRLTVKQSGELWAALMECKPQNLWDKFNEGK